MIKQKKNQQIQKRIVHESDFLYFSLCQLPFSQFQEEKVDQNSITYHNNISYFKIEIQVTKMNEEQKLQHLAKQIDRLETQKSHLITSSKPKAHFNIVRMVIILVICVLTGYFAGKNIFGTARKIEKKQREYKWFGLQKYWSKQEEEQKKQWWLIWK